MLGSVGHAFPGGRQRKDCKQYMQITPDFRPSRSRFATVVDSYDALRSSITYGLLLNRAWGVTSIVLEFIQLPGASRSMPDRNFSGLPHISTDKTHQAPDK